MCMFDEDLVYELIPVDYFITKRELIRITGFNDRYLRDIVSNLKQKKTIISTCTRSGYKRALGTDKLHSIDEIDQEINLVMKSIREINSRKKVFNKQLRQYIAYLKILESEKVKREGVNNG